ncbi:PorP/SprF family type IX secretion system membrane protein [Flavobacterium ardleyense]|uniref:PorP/SprF family type IX secretion system membrane protein n=1 Tax=Flavobacterium ardleyense TaxID=2038737 RepID=A0ABW5Z7Y2_9FLAO
MKHRYFLLLTSLLFSITLFSQDNAYSSFDINLKNSIKFNKHLLNPAFSFARETAPTITIVNRRQWVNFENAPQFYFGNYLGSLSDRSRFGVGLYQQSVGVLKNFGGVLNYSYNVPVGYESNLTFGLNTYFYNSAFDVAKVITIENEPLLENQKANSLIAIKPGINFGTEFFDFGIAVNNMVLFNIATSEMVKDNQENSYLGHIMYTGYLSSYRSFLDEAKFSTLFFVEKKKDATGLAANFMLDIPNKGWVQGGYNTLAGFSAGVGVTISEKFSIGYNYDLGLGDISQLGSSHQFLLAYTFEEYGESNKTYVPITNKSKNNAKKAPGTPAKSAAEIAKENAEKLANAKLERERLALEAAANAEKNRLALEEAARLKAEEVANKKAQAEQDRLDAEEAARTKSTTDISQAEKDRLAAEEAARAKAAADKAKAEASAKASAKAQAEKDKLAADEAARAKAARAKAAADRAKALAVAKTKAEKDRLAAEEAARAKAAADKAQADAASRAQAEKDRLAAAEVARAKAAADKSQADAASRAQAEKDRLAAEEAARARVLADKAQADAASKAQAEKDRLAAEEAARAKAAADKAQADAASKAQAEKDRLAAEEAARAKALANKAQADAASKAQAEKDRLAAEEAARAKAVADKAQADASSRAQAEKDRLAAEEAARVKALADKAQADAASKAQAEKDRLAAEEAARVKAAKDKANAAAEKDRLAAEEAARAKAASDKAQADKDRLAADEAALRKKLESDESNKVVEAFKKDIELKTATSDKLTKSLESIVKERDEDLKEFLLENTLNADGTPRAAKGFVSTSESNAKLQSLKSEINVNKVEFDKLIRDFEASNNQRQKEIKQKGISDIDAKPLNDYYLKMLNDLKLKRETFNKLEKEADIKIQRIKDEKEAERLRRIKRADYDSESERNLRNQQYLESLKKNQEAVSGNQTTTKNKDGESNANTNAVTEIPIIKKLTDVSAGYYLVLETFSNLEETKIYLATVIKEGGGSNVNFFYNLHNSTYYVYIGKTDGMGDANEELKAKGSKTYNKNMFIAKVE